MRIIPHYVYRFKFIDPFNGDDYTGIYKVLAVYSFDELLLNEIDLFAETYKPLNLVKETVFYPNLSLIKTGKIYKLLKLNEEYEIIRYMPEYLIDGIPVASVKKYYDLAVALHIGIYDDPIELVTLNDDIKELAKYRTGIEDCKSVVYSIKEEWKTVSDYLAIKQQREDIINGLTTEENSNDVYNDEIVTIGTKTYFEQTQTLTKKIQEMKAIISAYEATLISLNNQ